jgi:hypothetical protein
MGQAEAVCPHCGHDFPEPRRRAWWAYQSTIRGWLTVIAVLSIPFAFFHYVGPKTHPAAVAVGLACCSLLCSWLLKNSPIWTTIFDLIALVSLVSAFLFMIR